MTEVRRGPRTRKPNEGGVIESVRPSSIAEAIGLRAGDRVVAIDGAPLRDSIDVQFYAAEEAISLEVIRDGTAQTFEIEKHPDENLGVAFEDDAFDGVRICNNSCFFCFLKGNPKGMRKTLYVKDDDYRLSFAHGNFVTLTNLSEADWERLAEQRLSPLNVSVHATEPELRRYLLGNKHAPDICAQLRRLGELGIQANTQVVLCPGVNDGDALRRTIDDLAALWPVVQNVSVVPVGATTVAEERIGHGAHAEEVEGCTPEHAREVVELVAPYQRRFRDERGRTFVYLADEYYLIAGIRPPPASHYDGFPQFENGIGMARSLEQDWRAARRRLRAGAASMDRSFRRITLVCGALIAPTLARIAGELEDASGVRVSVRPVANTLFGPRVNVSGLLVGADFERELRGVDPGDIVLLPRYALDYNGARFLDDMTPGDLQSRLAAPLAFASTMTDVLQILGQPLESNVTGATRAAVTNGKMWVDPAEGGAITAAR